jgi:hypothetical protein
MVRGHDYRFLVQRTYGIPATSAGLNAINAAARDFVTEMGYARELCPFQGPISVHKVETRKTDRTSTGSVFCNGDWRDLTRAHHVNLSDDQRWRVERRGRSGGGPGTLQWRVSDVTQDVEDHGCYACKAGSLGRRTSDRTVTLTTEVDGVSRTSTAVDTSLWDVRATIEFRRDSTYTIFVRAASSTGLARRNVSHVVSGACDTDGEKDDGTAKRSAPLELRLGPFRGTPFDARLQGKGRLDAQKTDEAERYIDFDFNLRRLK